MRKDCEIHNLYLMNDRLIVMLIYFDDKYYFDIIKDNVKRDLMYILKMIKLYNPKTRIYSTNWVVRFRYYCK